MHTTWRQARTQRDTHTHPHRRRHRHTHYCSSFGNYYTCLYAHVHTDMRVCIYIWCVCICLYFRYRQKWVKTCRVTPPILPWTMQVSPRPLTPRRASGESGCRVAGWGILRSQLWGLNSTPWSRLRLSMSTLPPKSSPPYNPNHDWQARYDRAISSISAIVVRLVMVFIVLSVLTFFHSFD